MKDFTRDFPTKEDFKPQSTKEKLLVVQNDIDHYNRQVAKIDQKIYELTNTKSSLSIKISKKTKYKSLLLKELFKEKKEIQI